MNATSPSLATPRLQINHPMAAAERAVLVCVYLNIALYAFSYQLQSPIEPYLVERLVGKTAAASTYGQLTSAFSALQTVGSLAIGVFLDKVGPRTTFVLVFLCSAWSYYLRANCTTIEGLYWSKVPALLQHAFLVAQAVIAQTVPHERRPNALGRIMTAYTVGATLGTFVGGRLGGTEGNHRAGALVAVGGSLLSVVLCVMLLPASSTDALAGTTASSQKSAARESSCAPGTPKHYMQVLRKAWLPLSIKFITACGVSMYTTALPLVYKNMYGASPSLLGTVMAVTMVINAVAGLFAVGWLSSFFGERQAIQHSTHILALGYLFIVAALHFRAVGSDGVTTSVYPLVCINVALSVVGHSMATLVTSQSTSLVGENDKGAVIGIEHALFSFARIASPTLGVMLMEVENTRLTWLAGACASTALAAAALLRTFGGLMNTNPAGSTMSGGIAGGGSADDSHLAGGVYATRKRARKAA